MQLSEDLPFHFTYVLQHKTRRIERRGYQLLGIFVLPSVSTEHLQSTLSFTEAEGDTTTAGVCVTSDFIKRNK